MEASTAAQWPAPLDAMAAAPDHHSILLENEQVRVLDTRLGPGQMTPVRTHPWPSVLYILGWSDFVRYDPTGKVLLDSRTFDAPPKKGDTLWSAPLGPHQAKNVGDSVLHVIAVEMKKASF